MRAPGAHIWWWIGGGWVAGRLAGGAGVAVAVAVAAVFAYVCI
jgi:hypothetical protein